MKLAHVAQSDQTLSRQQRSTMVNESASNRHQQAALDLYKNPLTRQEVETIIERSLGKQFKILRYYVETFTNENLGFLGAHRNFVVEVSHNGTGAKETHTYFLKSIPYNIDGQAKFIEDSKIFYKETSFYSLIMPELMKSSIDKSWAAQCYLVKENALVFENLKLKNYTLREKFLEEQSLKAALSSVAKLHAASLLAEKRLGKTFIEMYPHLFDELLFCRDGHFAGWYRSGVNAAVKVAEKLGFSSEIVPKVCNLIFEKTLPSKTKRNVLCHGDVWSYNMMFNGSNCVLVDFQLMRYVPPMTDVVQLIYLNARRQLRDKCEMSLLKHYHEILCDALRDGGLETPKFQNVLNEYEDMRIVGMVMTILYFQYNHIDGETQAELMQDTEGFNAMLFNDRTDMVFENMEKDERYRDIIESSVKELFEKSAKYLK